LASKGATALNELTPAAASTGEPVDASVDQARILVSACREVVDAAAARLAADSAKGGRVDLELMDREQVLAYDLAASASRVTAAEEMLAYGGLGDLEALLTCAFAGDVAAGLAGAAYGRAGAWALSDSPLERTEVREALGVARDPRLLERIADVVLRGAELPRHLGEDLEMARRTFGDYAREKVAPEAERVHRGDEDIPEHIISELAGMGVFGLSIPERFGGFAQGESEDDFMSMVVVTEELSRGSLGVAGSLITRPEILSKALVKGGTPEQQERWLPRIASGELMCAVAVTEPDYGSDVASLKVTAQRDGEFFVVNGVKTWCTFGGRADLLMLLARTGAVEDKHKGLSLFVIEKPPVPGHSFSHDGEHGGRMEARAIGTIGYRGMHSFEISFEDYRVPGGNLVGGDDKLGKGFYLQMDAFANGRLQTAARALGVMQAAFDEAVAYANARHVFGTPIGRYQLTQAKLARMAYLIAASRAFTYRSAQLLGAGGGQLESSMVKQFSCLAAEWLTREAQQIHGGMGYAEEYPVSRYFVDARVLSIFEGADEVLALRVIVRRLLEDALMQRQR
jgi:(2S)-methylsuccinyl-CoA dehydrogenase